MLRREKTRKSLFENAPDFIYRSKFSFVCRSALRSREVVLIIHSL